MNKSDAQLLPHVEKMHVPHAQRFAFPDIPGSQEGLYGPLTNGQRITHHLHKPVMDGIVALSGALMKNGLLDPCIREIIIVRTGYLTGSAYEVEQHASLAACLGVPQSTLEALKYVAPTGLSGREIATVNFVDELVNNSHPSDSSVLDAQRFFSVPQLFEIIAVTGNWWTLSRILCTSGVAIDEDRIGNRPIPTMSGDAD